MSSADGKSIVHHPAQQGAAPSYAWSKNDYVIVVNFQIRLAQHLKQNQGVMYGVEVLRSLRPKLSQSERRLSSSDVR